MHELYLWPFAEAVRAGTVNVMCKLYERTIKAEITLMSSQAAIKKSIILMPVKTAK